MSATRQLNIRCPDGDREAIARVQRELAEQTGRPVSQTGALLFLLRKGLEAMGKR